MDNKEYCINIVFIPKDDPYFVTRLLAKREYSSFAYTHSDPEILRRIELFANNLEVNRNDSLGLKIIINNDIKYETFVDLLNICLKSNISDWLPYGDSLFVFHRDFGLKKPDLNATVSMMPDAPLFELNYEETYRAKWYQKIASGIEKIAIITVTYLIILYLCYRQTKNEC